MRTCRVMICRSNVLEKFDPERVAHKLSDPVLSKIAGETSDGQFLVVAGLDQS